VGRQEQEAGSGKDQNPLETEFEPARDSLIEQCHMATVDCIRPGSAAQVRETTAGMNYLTPELHWVNLEHV
jgi:hypothetical protein